LRLSQGSGVPFWFRWPMYDAWRYLKNGKPRRMYRQEQSGMVPTPIEQAVISQLRQDGIAMIHCDELLPGNSFAQLQDWAEAAVDSPETRQKIAEITTGVRPEGKGGKFYIVRPLGKYPSFDLQEHVAKVVLSEPILRIVSGYLRMFSILAAVDFWYNVACQGPEVFSQRWHRDPEDRALVKTFLYLRDCDESNGPFCYVPGTHNAGPLRQKIGRHNYPDDGVIDRRFPVERRKICTGKAGTLVFCDTTGFHKGGHATAGARYLMTAMYTTNASEPIARSFRTCALTGSTSNLSAAARYAARFLKTS
jgi:hypothetical protein